MGKRLLRTLGVITVTLATIILLSPLAVDAAAQSVQCVDQPALGVFDSNGDRVLTVGEIRAAAPDNAKLQGIASQLEARGLTGIQYAGCGASGGGTTVSGGTGTPTSGGTPASGATNGITPTTTDGTGNGMAKTIMLFGAAGILALGGAVAWRLRRRA